MNAKKVLLRAGLMTFVALTMMAAAPAAYAHCDTYKGPVIQDGLRALDKGDVTPVLKWIKAEHETELKEAFAQALAVRKSGPDAQKLADKYFLETLVRLHRAGEGAPYTGIKPADTPVEPAVAAADEAIDQGSVNELVKYLNVETADGITAKYERLQELKKHAGESVEAGREYVEAYVTFVHYVERLANALSSPVEHAEVSEGKPEQHEAQGH